jgi:hypothetical protein
MATESRARIVASAALVLVLVAGCKKADESAPARASARDAGSAASAPISAPVDAAPAPAACIPLQPLGEAAKLAGIRPITHLPFHVEVDALPAPPRDVVILPVGKPTLVRAKDLWFRSGPSADLLTPLGTIKNDHVTLTAPASLEGALLTASPKRLAIGYAALTTLARFTNELVPVRMAASDKPKHVSAHALLQDDLDGDGKPELVAYLDVEPNDDPRPTQGANLLTVAGVNHDLGIAWGTGERAFAPLDFGNFPSLFLAPAAISGGKPLLFGLDGTRIQIDGKQLVALQRTNPNARDLGAMIEDVRLAKKAPPPPPPAPLCLKTSSTEPAQLATK